MANSQDRAPSQPPDLLAAVVLHILVSRGREGMTVADVARACERSLEDPGDALEVEAAVGILVGDGLAERMGSRAEGLAPDDAETPAASGARVGAPQGQRAPALEVLVRPTRAAVRAEELSF